MLASILAALHLDDPASLKRALTTGVGAVVLLAVNPVLEKYGIPPLSDTVVGVVAALLATFVLQSSSKSKAQITAEMSVAVAAAASGVKTPTDSVAIINAKIAELTAQRMTLAPAPAAPPEPVAPPPVAP